MLDGEVEKGDVEETCRAVLMREFIRDLPLGYEIIILSGGASVGLSGAIGRTKTTFIDRYFARATRLKPDGVDSW